MNIPADFVERFELEMGSLCRRGVKEKLEKLDLHLSSDVSQALSHDYSHPAIAFAYLHKGNVLETGDFREFEEHDGNTSEWALMRRLDGNHNYQGLLREIIQHLPRQSGIPKRTPAEFTIRVKTMIPKETNPNIDTYLTRQPIISLVVVGANDKYPHNIRHRSMRAVRDIAYIGSMILHAGMDYTPQAIPFWVQSDITFLGNPISSTQNKRINNLQFLENVYHYKR